MALSIKSEEVESKVRRLADLTGTSLTRAISNAVDAELARRERTEAEKESLFEEIMAISRHCSSLPVLDVRSEDEIMGWDENGLPT